MHFQTKVNATSLTVEELRPGRYYRVVQSGDADPSLKGEIVLGAASHLHYSAVTITDNNRGGWLGTQWWGVKHAKHHRYEDPDVDARFVEVTPVEPAPEPTEVWLVTDRSECGMVDNDTAIFRTREAAVAQAREWIEAYRDDSEVADEIDAVLAHFDEQAAMGDGLFGAGSERDSSVFYVEVCRFTLRG